MTIAANAAVDTSLGIIITEIVFSHDCKELDMKTHRFWLEAFRFCKGKTSFQYMIPKMFLTFPNKGLLLENGSFVGFKEFFKVFF